MLTFNTRDPVLNPPDFNRYPIDLSLMDIVRNCNHSDSNCHLVIKPINAYPYTYLRTPPETMCANSVFILFMIKSSPDNFERRQAIRHTWTNQSYFDDTSVRHVFLLAIPTNYTTKKRVTKEIRRYQDIVQMTFTDEYYNNTYKTVGGINWAAKFCSSAQFVMLVDDDYYVATDNLITYLHSVPDYFLPTLFAGTLCDRCQPQRYPPTGKWYLSDHDYPYHLLPPFIHAGFVVMSMEYVKYIHIGIPFIKNFIFDDVFLGLVAAKLGVTPLNNPLVLNRKEQFSQFKNVIAAHGFGDPSELRQAWSSHVDQDLL